MGYMRWNKFNCSAVACIGCFMTIHNTSSLQGGVVNEHI